MSDIYITATTGTPDNPDFETASKIASSFSCPDSNQKNKTIDTINKPNIASIINKERFEIGRLFFLISFLLFEGELKLFWDVGSEEF